MRVKDLVRNGAIPARQKSNRSFLGSIRELIVRKFPRSKFGGVLLEDYDDAIYIVLLFGASAIAVFFYVICSNTLNAVEQKSLSYYHVNNANLNCTEIPTRLPYQLIPGSYDGTWVTSEDNDRSKNIFILELSGSTITDAEYKLALKYFSADLAALGEKGRQRNSLWSLMQLCTYSGHHQPTKLGLFFSAEAPYFLNTLVNRAALVSGAGVCLGFPHDPAAPRFLYGAFNQARASLDLMIPLKLSASSIVDTDEPRAETCPKQGNWTNLAFNPNSGGSTTSAEGVLSFDVRSTFLAMGLNMGTVSIDNLQMQSNPYLGNLGLFAVYDNYYHPPMASIICVNATHPKHASSFAGSQTPSDRFPFPPQVCFLTNSVKNNVVQLFYPMATMLKTVRDARQKSVSPFRMQQCVCPRDKYEQDCNKQSFFFGYFYATDIRWDTRPGTATIRFGIQQYVKLNNLIAGDDADHYDVAFTDSFTDVFSASQAILRKAPYGANSPLKDLPGQTLSTRLRAAWAALSDIDMSMAYFRSLEFVGAINTAVTINVNGVQLHDVRNQNEPAVSFRNDLFDNHNDSGIMCEDFLSFPQAWPGFAATAPVDFTESYYTCSKSVKFALQTSVGNAFAATSLFFNIAWPLLGIGVVSFYRWSNGDSRRTMRSHRELQQLREALDDVKQDSLRDVLEVLLAKMDAEPHSDGDHDRALRRFRLLFDGRRAAGDSRHLPRGEQEALEEICSELAGRLCPAEAAEKTQAGASGESFSAHQPPFLLPRYSTEGLGVQLTDAASPMTTTEHRAWAPRRDEGGSLPPPRLSVEVAGNRDQRASFVHVVHRQQLGNHPLAPLAAGTRKSLSLADRRPRDRMSAGPSLALSALSNLPNLSSPPNHGLPGPSLHGRSLREGRDG